MLRLIFNLVYVYLDLKKSISQIYKKCWGKGEVFLLHN